MNSENIIIAKKTLNLLKKKSWNSIKLNEVFVKSSKFANSLKSKNDLLKNLNRYFDYLLKKNSRNIEKSTAKDMLFEVLMARFDILEKYRISIKKIVIFFKHSPQNFLLLMPSFLESMIETASLIKLNTKGITGSLKIKGILIIYIATLFVWIEDETISLEKTMTALDKYLDRIDNIINNLK